MSEDAKDAGLIEVLAHRLETQRLPYALSLKERVDQGEILNEFDIIFLEEVLEDSRRIQPLLDRHPEWQDLATKLMNLYKEITEEALQNEKSKQGGFPGLD